MWIRPGQWLRPAEAAQCVPQQRDRLPAVPRQRCQDPEVGGEPQVEDPPPDRPNLQRQRLLRLPGIPADPPLGVRVQDVLDRHALRGHDLLRPLRNHRPDRLHQKVPGSQIPGAEGQGNGGRGRERRCRRRQRRGRGRAAKGGLLPLHHPDSGRVRPQTLGRVPRRLPVRQVFFRQLRASADTLV